MFSTLQLSPSKGRVTPFRTIRPAHQEDFVDKTVDLAPDGGKSSHETLWDNKEPPVSLREKIRFLWWSILIILSQMKRDLFDLHNGFASLFLADLLSHFFVSHDASFRYINHG